MAEESQKSMYVVGLTVLLALVWLAWSGHFETLLLIFGVGSVLITVWVSLRLQVVGEEGQPLKWGVRPLSYGPWLIGAIVSANIDVLKRILGFKPVNPIWTIVPAKQKSNLGRVVFANSITLTPGTVSVDIYDIDGEHFILVNAIAPEGADDLKDGGDMGRRCQVLEGE